MRFTLFVPAIDGKIGSNPTCAKNPLNTMPPTSPEPNGSDEMFRTMVQSSEQQTLSAALSNVGANVPGYEILAEIGRGGMGVVYKARQLKANRIVALKMILSGGHAGIEEQSRFRSEIETTAHLKHPGIVQVYEVGEHAGLPYFSMEFCEGGSLANKTRGQQLRPMAAAALVERIARAVEAAHLAGIVHRDLKPGNIMMTEDGTPKVGDFGLAKRLDTKSDATRTGAIMGTPNYMAPEQASGKTKTVGPAADVYALGVVLYELLAGRPPFDADTIAEQLMLVTQNAPPPFEEFRKDVPSDLETICLKCLAKDPAHRYATAGQLAEDLRRLQDGETISARQWHAVQRFAWMIGRSQYDTHFARYANFFLLIAPLILLPEIFATIIRFAELPLWWILPVYVARTIAGLSLFLYFGQGRIWPANPAEQHVLGMWGGFILTAMMLHANLHSTSGSSLYQALAATSAVSLFSLGAMFWGGFYLFGLSFLLVIPIMSFDERLCPLEFGILWTIVLVWMGLRLRKIAAVPK